MDEKSVIMKEYFGSGGGEPTAIWRGGGPAVNSTGSVHVEVLRAKAAGAGSLLRSFRAAFLPEGYPSSVTPDYLPFQFWDTLQGLSTYIRSMLSTQVLLGGLGVGESTASVIGATFQWFIRDFTGMLGGILFTLYKGSNLDSSAKQWRLAADIINDVGMLLDLLSPLVPGAFLPILCLGSISRAITGTASGATRAALTQHFALRQNAADISAKESSAWARVPEPAISTLEQPIMLQTVFTREGSQETAATMGGMLLGMLVARITARHVAILWAVFLALTLFHMYANYRAVRSLCLTSLNPERTSILLRQFVDKRKPLSPPEVAPLERVLPLPRLPAWLLPWRPPMAAQQVVLGARLSNLTLPGGWDDLTRLKQRYGQESYLLVVQGGDVHVVLSLHSSLDQLLRAYVHAVRLADCLAASANQRRGGDGGDVAELAAQQWMHDKYDTFLREITNAGWAVDRVLLSPRNWRAEWRSTGDKKD